MSNEALVVQLLEWIGDQPRGYHETMEAWRSSCPRLTVWEDALSEGLIERISGRSLSDGQVQVTEKGRRYLQDCAVNAKSECPASAQASA